MPEIDYAALEALLTAETAALRSLCAALVAQKAALEAQGAQPVLAAVSAAQSHARRLQALEEERGALVARCGRDANWAALCAGAPEPYRSRLALLRGEAQGLLAQVTAVVEANRDLAAAGLSFTQRYLSTLRPALQPGYRRPAGQQPQTEQGAWLNQRA